MSQSIHEVMAQKKEAALQSIKAALWEGEPEQAIEIALAGGISSSEVLKLQTEIETIQATIEGGNAVNLAQLEKEVEDSLKAATESEAQLEKAQAAHDAASSRAQEARQALQSGRNAVYVAASTFEAGQVPDSIKPSETVKACIQRERTLAVTDAKRVQLQAKVRELSLKIEDTRKRLCNSTTCLSREGSFSKDVQTLEKQSAKLEAEKAKVMQELAAFK